MDKKSKPRYIPAQNPEYYRTLPDDISPAVLNKLALSWFPQYKRLKNKIKSGGAFSATMLDLFLEGFLEMRKTANDSIEISVNGEKTPENDYEKTLISLISAASGGSPSVTLDGVQQYIKDNPVEVIKIQRKFETEVAENAKKSPYLEEYTRNKSGLVPVYIILAVAAVLIGTFYTLVMGANYDYPLLGYFTAVIFTGLTALFCARISKTDTALSQLGADKSALWFAFGKFLDDFTSFREKEFPEFKLWEKYLVYATALGKSKKLINELALYYPVENIGESDGFMRNNLFVEAMTAGYLFDTIESIQEKTYSAASDSGGGGGFSSSDGGSGGGSSGSGAD
jgi:uncharacterized membrane protein